MPARIGQPLDIVRPKFLRTTAPPYTGPATAVSGACDICKMRRELHTKSRRSSQWSYDAHINQRLKTSCILHRGKKENQKKTVSMISYKYNDESTKCQRDCCCCCSHINSHNQVRGLRTDRLQPLWSGGIPQKKNTNKTKSGIGTTRIYHS